MTLGYINYADMFNNNYETVLNSYNTQRQSKPQTSQKTQKATTDVISFKSNKTENADKPQKKSNGTLKGLAIGAAITGVAAWLLTRGKVKPSAVMKTPKVFKTNGNFKFDDLKGYANAAKNEYGKAIDTVHFIKGDKFSEFAKGHKEFANLSDELKALGSLGENDIIAVAAKEGNPLCTNVFISSGLDKDVAAAFNGNPMLKVNL